MGIYRCFGIGIRDAHAAKKNKLKPKVRKIEYWPGRPSSMVLRGTQCGSLFSLVY